MDKPEGWNGLLVWLLATGLSCPDIKKAVEYWQNQLPLFPDEEGEPDADS